MDTFENTSALQNQLQTLEAKRRSISKSFTIFSATVLVLIILAIIFKEQFEIFALLGGMSVLILMAIIVFGFIYFFISKIAVNSQIRLIQNKLTVLEPTKFSKKSKWSIIITIVVIFLLAAALIWNHMYVRSLDCKTYNIRCLDKDQNFYPMN